MEGWAALARSVQRQLCASQTCNEAADRREHQSGKANNMAKCSWHSMFSKARQKYEDSVRKSRGLGPVPELSSREGKFGPVGEASEEAGKKRL